MLQAHISDSQLESHIEQAIEYRLHKAVTSIIFDERPLGLGSLFRIQIGSNFDGKWPTLNSILPLMLACRQYYFSQLHPLCAAPLNRYLGLESRFLRLPYNRHQAMNSPARPGAVLAPSPPTATAARASPWRLSAHRRTRSTQTRKQTHSLPHSCHFPISPHPRPIICAYTHARARVPARAAPRPRPLAPRAGQARAQGF
jgi:hypothetical protein